MNGQNALHRIVESFGRFPLEEKEYLVDIFTKELREEKREQIFKRHLEARRNYQKGTLR